MSDDGAEITPSGANEIVQAAEPHAQGELSDGEFDRRRRQALQPPAES
jgi:uncharacterized membrane protein